MFPLFQIRCSGLRLGFRVNVYGLGFMLAGLKSIFDLSPGLKSNFDLIPGLKSIFVLSPTTPMWVPGWGLGVRILWV